MNHFILFSNCIPVKGYSRSIICDLQRNEFWYIPNDLFFILTELKRYSIQKIKNYYNNKQDDIIQEYFDFLISNQLGFMGSLAEFKNFPLLNLEWDDPSLITNSIIDSNKNSNHDFKDIFGQLELLGCKHVQLRFFDDIKYNYINNIVSLLINSTIISVEIIISYTSISSESIDSLIEKYNRINQIIVYNAPVNKLIIRNFTKIYYVKEIIYSQTHCGIISKSLFSVNVKNFTESISFNSCLNRKISIDTDGNIKNCPSMQRSFGNEKKRTLASVVSVSEFKRIWKITKDKINTCKMCEFRYICTDCRAYTENPSDIYSKPLKCGYDPITCQWSEWSTNPLKTSGKKYYGFN